MKKLLLFFMLISGVVNATGYSGLNTELFYLYGTFVIIVLLIVGVDQGVKYIYKKLKGSGKGMNDSAPVNQLEE